MRVLFCTSYFWPDVTGIALYSTGFADHLAQRGDEVTVVTGFPHYPSWRRLPGRPRLAATEYRHGVQVRRRWHQVPRRQTAASRVIYEASFLTGLTAVRDARPDVVVATSPCLASAAVALAAGRLHDAPVGLVFQDVLGRAATQSGIRGGGSLGSVIKGLELGIARRATRVGLTADGFRRPFVDGGVAPERIIPMRNWLERSPPTQTREEARASLGWPHSAFICLHAGNMGLKQNLGTLIDAAQLLAQDDVLMVLAGDGNDRARLERRAAGLGSANVSFLGVQQPGAYEAMLEAADVLIVNQRSSVTDMALPSKLTAYFAAGRPVIAAVAPGSETAAELQRSDAGIVVAPEDPSALASAVHALRADPELRAELGRRGRRYAAKQLARAAVLARWADFVDETLCAVSA